MKQLLEDLKSKGLNVSLGTKENAEYWSLLEKNFDPVSLFTKREIIKRNCLVIETQDFLKIIDEVEKIVKKHKTEKDKKLYFLKKEQEKEELLSLLDSTRSFVKGNSNRIYTSRDVIIEILEQFLERDIEFRTKAFRQINEKIVIKLGKQVKKFLENQFKEFFEKKNSVESIISLEEIKNKFFTDIYIKACERTKKRIELFLELLTIENNCFFFNKSSEKLLERKISELDNFINKKDLILLQALISQEKMKIKEITQKDIIFFSNENIIDLIPNFEGFFTKGVGFSGQHPVLKAIYYSLGYEKIEFHTFIEKKEHEELIRQINEKI